MNTVAADSQTRVRVKICGITRLADAIAAAKLGADAIGLVFYNKSPRAVSAGIAKEIALAMPPFVNKVGLFVDAPADEIYRVLEQVPLDTLQFHGNEPPDQCRQYFKPYIKAVRMQNGMDLRQIESRYPDASALLLDTYVEGIQGGTGETFDWSKIPSDLDKPVILAGGLTAENVAQAIHQVSPYAVDVSGGVEAEKGVKEFTKMSEFIREVRDAK